MRFSEYSKQFLEPYGKEIGVLAKFAFSQAFVVFSFKLHFN